MKTEQEIQEQLAAEDFPGLPIHFQMFLHNFTIWLRESLVHLSYLNCVILACGIIMNIFHFIVLTRKNMRTTVTNVIMIGLSLSDICFMWGTLIEYLNIIRQSVGLHECVAPDGYYDTLLSLISNIVNDFTRRLSPWLVIFMAMIRAIVITKAMDSKYDFLQTSKTGWFTLLISIVLSGVFSLYFYFIITIMIDTITDISGDAIWKPPKSCGYPKNYTVTRYYLYLDPEVYQRYSTINETVSKIIPCILFPILSAVLVFQLVKTQKFQKKNMKSGDNGGSKTDRTNKLVILMTVFFMIAELPPGLLRFIGAYTADVSLGMMSLSFALSEYWSPVAYINSSIHGILCFIMSTQYRSEVKSFFCTKKRKTEV